jgi:hypothetical protein
MRRLPPTVLALWGVGVLVSLTLLVPAAAASAMPSGPFHAPSLADRDPHPPSSHGGDSGDPAPGDGRSGSGSGSGSERGSDRGAEDDPGSPPPPPVLPEAPVSALLPLSALTVGGVVIAVRRRRRPEGGS